MKRKEIIRNLEAEAVALQILADKIRESCPHQIEETKHGGAWCDECGKHFGWWCPKSDNHLCHYPTTMREATCQYCGEPSERK